MMQMPQMQHMPQMQQMQHMQHMQHMQQNINFQNPIMGNTEGTPIDLLRSDIKESPRLSDTDNDSVKIKKLVRDIDDDLNINIKTKYLDNTEKDTDTETESDIEKPKKNKKKSKHQSTGLIDTMFDAILLFIIYMLLSQNFIKTFIGKYITSINVNSDGYVSNLGVAIYGLIFILIFILAKILVNKMA